MDGIEILLIHREQLEVFGGLDGTIDNGVVESAAAAPGQTMFGEYLNTDIAEMSAAYLFGFAASQGFRDGNKRVGANAALQFLLINGYDINCTSDELYVVTMAVANHQMDKQAVAAWIRQHLKPNSEGPSDSPADES